MRPVASRILRVLISALLLAYLLWRADLKAIWTTVGSADPLWLGVACALHVPGYLLSAVRWRLLLLAQRIQVPLSVLLASYLVGSFFNQLLPTTVGGDVVRVYDTARYSQAHEASLLAVVVERLTGVLALALLALLGLLAGVHRLVTVPLAGLVAAMIALTVVPLWIVWSPRTLEALMGITRRLLKGRMEGMLGRAGQALALLGKGKGTLSLALALAFLLQITVVIHFYLIGHALGFAVPLSFFFLAIPVATFILMLPVSINGIGVREGIYAVFFSEFGIPVASAIAFSWLGFGMALLYAGVGGVIYSVRR